VKREGIVKLGEDDVKKISKSELNGLALYRIQVGMGTDQMKEPSSKEKIWVFRMVHYQNLPHILKHGIYCRRSPNAYPGYVNIGSADIINLRETVVVKCDPVCVANDYVSFYFGVRTPMLYKIITGNGVIRHPQEDIVYLCCKFRELAESGLEWCFTDGNAATRITEFYTNADNYGILDWKSIYATEWGDNNSDADHDRMRKKQAEFLVKGYVPATFIRAIVVQKMQRQQLVQQWVSTASLDIKVHSNRPQYYFPWNM
jgi:ssDNA thymidine ADP-ribosyltransferase, DarT